MSSLSPKRVQEAEVSRFAHMPPAVFARFTGPLVDEGVGELTQEHQVILRNRFFLLEPHDEERSSAALAALQVSLRRLGWYEAPEGLVLEAVLERYAALVHDGLLPEPAFAR